MFSAARPTGFFYLGNYIGALWQLLILQAAEKGIGELGWNHQGCGGHARET